MFVTSCNISRKILYYPQRISERRLNYIRENYEDVKEIKIDLESNVSLHGWFIQKDVNKYPTILYFGGNAEEVSLNIEDFNFRLDANFILFNYRGYGLSAGSPSEERLKSDAEKIYITMIEQFSLNPDKIIAMGRSLGSGIAVYLSVRMGIPKIILITPYDSIKEVAYDYFPRFVVNAILSDKFETTDICNQLQANVLMLVAENDNVINPKHAENLYNKITCTKRLAYVKDSGHNTISQNSTYWEEIKNFINN